MKIPFLYTLELKIRNVSLLLKNLPKILKYKFLLGKANKISVPDSIYKNLKLKIRGKNNTVTIEDTKILYKAEINISIYGDNNEIRIGKNFSLSGKFSITMGQQHPNFEPGVSKSSVIIGENTSVEELVYVTYNSNTSLHIGDSCMISTGVNIFNTDAHPIIDIETGKVINKIRGIDIGSHCWLGKNSTILKNTRIANDCIVGWGSVVSGKFDTPNCVLAGNPAKYVKTGVTWDSNGTKYGYIDNKE